ncbi:MAG TPA: hypothetical protein DCZ72_00940 [Armatimonadetes bacterium]|nr:hypothetical protein [Armatimonadota bacterium]
MPTVEIQQIGARHALVPAFDVPVPPEFWGGSEGVRLRDLIALVVRWEVLAYNERAEQHGIVRALGQHEIAAGAAAGRVDPGGGEHPRARADENQAVAHAWQAFEDGLYLVFLDDQPRHRLDEPVVVNPDSRIRFVRLVMLRSS